MYQPPLWSHDIGQDLKIESQVLIVVGCPRGVMVKVMDCGILVSEFVPQSRYYVHFRANTLGKGMNPLNLPAMGEMVPLLFFLVNDFGIK